MFLPSNATRRGIILTRDPTTGEPRDADSAPTVAVRRNGSSESPTVTVTNVATGRYTYSYALTDFSAADGDQISEILSATVAGIAAEQHHEYLAATPTEEGDVSVEITDTQGTAT